MLGLVAGVSTGVFVAAAVGLAVRPRRRLAGRVRPYALPSLTALGRPADARAVAHAAGGGTEHHLLRQVVALVAGSVQGEVGAARLQARLAQAGVYDVEGDRLVVEHRFRQVLAGLAGLGLCATGGVLAGLSASGVLGLAVLGLVVGASRPEAAVTAAVEERRRLLRAELPAVAQLLALRMRAGGSIGTSIATTAQRCHGEVADALGVAIATHRAGRPLDGALDGLATATPEPEAARLYRLLAGSARYGLDAAPELLRLAREGRTAHLTRLRRDATRRRGALLLPVIGLLAPLMLLFIAAPLPSLIGSGS